MPKADKAAVERRKANYKKNAYTQAWAEGRYTKAKGKGKGTAEDGGEDEDEVKVSAGSSSPSSGSLTPFSTGG